MRGYSQQSNRIYKHIFTLLFYLGSGFFIHGLETSQDSIQKPNVALEYNNKGFQLKTSDSK
jgi:hypothetical protein